MGLFESICFRCDRAAVMCSCRGREPLRGGSSQYYAERENRDRSDLAHAHLQSERNLHDIPEAVALHRTIRLAHEHAAEIFDGEAADALKRIERQQKAGKR